MEKEKWFSALPELLEGMGFPVEIEESRILWAMPYGDDDDMPAMGEMFLASSLGLELPEDIDYLQTSIVFMQDIPLAQLDALREFCAQLSRRLAGGYFSVHRMGGDSCFLEYAYDIALLEEAAEYQNNRLVETAVDLADAYLSLCWDAFAEICAGRMDAEQALEYLNRDEDAE